MSISNTIDYSLDYSETTGSLWLYSKYEATDFNADIANDISFRTFKYKANYQELQLLGLIQIIMLIEF